MSITHAQALRNASQNKGGRGYPGTGDPRVVDGNIFPNFKPKFRLEFGRGDPVFTIGSCFARNIEEALMPLEVELPTRGFSAPQEEWSGRGNGILNEYNAGSMSRRVLDALNGTQSPEATIVKFKDGFIDLLLPAFKEVSFERALARRQEIFTVYQKLSSSKVMVMTLGLVECWYDNETGYYLNRIPTQSALSADPNRFVFRRLGVSEIVSMMENALGALADLETKVVLTVSPVPLGTTFTTDDCVVANEYSKATLRVCADYLCQKFDNVDYFPSYEIVRSGGLSSYNEDNIHVRDALVKKITTSMVNIYSTYGDVSANEVVA